jgi:hypothetical protein
MIESNSNIITAIVNSNKVISFVLGTQINACNCGIVLVVLIIYVSLYVDIAPTPCWRGRVLIVFEKIKNWMD